MDNQAPEVEIEGTAVTNRLTDVRRARYTAAAQVIAAMGGATPTQEVLAQVQSDDEVVRRWRLKVGLLLAERTRALSGGSAVHLPEHLTATHLDNLRADRHRFVLDLRHLLPPEPRVAGRLGIIFHDAVAQYLSACDALSGSGQAGTSDSLGSQGWDRVEYWSETVENLSLLKNYVLAETEADREVTVGATTSCCRVDAAFQRLDGSG